MAIFQVIGTGISLAGKGIKSIVNRAREKRAAKKAAKAAAKAEQAEAQAGAILSKISLPVQGVVPESQGVVAEKVKSSGIERVIRRVPPVVYAVIGLVFLFFLFKRK